MQGTVREWRRKNQEREKPQGIDKQTTCYRCAGNHSSNLCKFKEAKCYSCSKKGHIAKVCRSKTAGKTLRKTQYVSQEDSVEEELGLYGVYTKPEVKKYTVN